MPGKMFYYRDEDGTPQDADIHEEVLNNPLADLYFTLRNLRAHVDDGHTLEQALMLFGSEQLRQAYDDGKFTLAEIDEALDLGVEAEDDFDDDDFDDDELASDVTD